jgi:DNA-binding HxlR family transcriptional regulator
MLGRTYETQDCSAARALEIIGERWSLMIIRHALFRGITRFGDFQTSLGIARNILTARLDWFLEAGLMERRPDSSGSAYQEYVLTEMGRELQPVVIALTHWGDRWAAPGDPPVTFRHSGCGGAVHLDRVCEECSEHPSIDEVWADPNDESASTHARA